MVYISEIGIMKCVFFLALLLPAVLAANIDLSTYPLTADLRPGSYRLHWSFNVEEQSIRFAVNVSTTGWIGLGLSPTGGMPNSDIVIGWVNDQGQAFLDDRFATAQSLPPVDKQQDWILEAGEQENGFTVLAFRRNWTTCDQQDRDINTDTARIIFSWNDVDPVSDDPTLATYHGDQNRGTLSINLLGGQQVPPDSDDLQTFDVAVNAVAVPSESTTYWCYVEEFPQDTRAMTHYVTKISPVITPGNELHVHHILIYECENLNATHVGFSAPCNSDGGLTGIMVSECRQGTLIGAWAVGGGVSLSFTNNYFVKAFSFFRNYVTVYVSSEFFQTAQILLDNSIVTGWRNVVCSSGEVCGHISRTSVSTGAHSIRHQNSSAVLGVSVYGFARAKSYGYPGGMRLSPIQCNYGQNSICLNNREQFNCSCLNGFVASLYGTDELICIAITCPPLTAPTNGSVTYSSTSDENGNYAFNAVALIGNSTRTCTGDGSSTTGIFDGEAAFCELTCVLPTPPLNGILFTNQTESSVITFQCDPGFSLVGTETATCNNSGSWDPDPALLECVVTGALNVAALSGGVVAIVMVLIVLVVIFLLVITITKKRKNVRVDEVVYETIDSDKNSGEGEAVMVSNNAAYGVRL